VLKIESCSLFDDKLLKHIYNVSDISHDCIDIFIFLSSLNILCCTFNTVFISFSCFFLSLYFFSCIFNIWRDNSLIEFWWSMKYEIKYVSIYQLKFIMKHSETIYFVFFITYLYYYLWLCLCFELDLFSTLLISVCNSSICSSIITVSSLSLSHSFNTNSLVFISFSGLFCKSLLQDLHYLQENFVKVLLFGHGREFKARGHGFAVRRVRGAAPLLEWSTRAINVAPRRRLFPGALSLINNARCLKLLRLCFRLLLPLLPRKLEA